MAKTDSKTNVGKTTTSVVYRQVEDSDGVKFAKKDNLVNFQIDTSNNYGDSSTGSCTVLGKTHRGKYPVKFDIDGETYYLQFWFGKLKSSKPAKKEDKSLEELSQAELLELVKALSAKLG